MDDDVEDDDVEDRNALGEYKVDNIKHKSYHNYWDPLDDLDKFHECPFCHSQLVLSDGNVPRSSVRNWLPNSIEPNSREYFLLYDSLNNIVSNANLIKYILENFTSDGRNSLIYAKISQLRSYALAHLRKTVASCNKDSQRSDE